MFFFRQRSRRCNLGAPSVVDQVPVPGIVRHYWQPWHLCRLASLEKRGIAYSSLLILMRYPFFFRLSRNSTATRQTHRTTPREAAYPTNDAPKGMKLTTSNPKTISLSWTRYPTSIDTLICRSLSTVLLVNWTNPIPAPSECFLLGRNLHNKLKRILISYPYILAVFSLSRRLKLKDFQRYSLTSFPCFCSYWFFFFVRGNKGLGFWA